MSSQSHPLVSIVTPMYNNVEYVEECIESVRAQTYQNWEYIIVNNCSTDGSGDIARRFSALDPRIRVLDNEELLEPAEANHNHALRQISPASKYCKMVFSDDWLFPHCVEQMVAVAEAHPSVGIVGAYGLQGAEPVVKWAGLPYPSHCVNGREICRLFLLKDIYVFGTPHTLLYRSDLIRSRDPFFNEANTHADREVCVDILRSCDFGFVHQVLTFTRERRGSLTEFSRRLNTSVGWRLYEAVKFGPDLLSPEEYRTCRARLINDYYNYLAITLALGGRSSEFWTLHKKALGQAGIHFSYGRLVVALLTRFLRAVTHPAETFRKLRLIRTYVHYDL